MRKVSTLLLIILAVVFTTNSFAQERTCAAHDMFLEQMKNNPQMRANQEALEKYTQSFTRDKAAGTRVVPVNVIVVYKTSAQNISDAQIESQISVLNKDYGGTNSDLNNVPNEFLGVTARGTGIQFELVNIERHYNRTREWRTTDKVKTTYPPTSPETTLNMWICNIGGGILGYAQFPGGNPATDGVVFSPNYCGSSDYDDGTFYLSAPYDKGRTATHEIGHYFNLRHIWGDGDCSATDYVDDTPSAASANYGCPSYPHNTCSSSDMFMNYMDYTDDQCMFMFSEGQSNRMWACLTSTRANLGNSGGGNIAPVADANGPYTVELGGAINFSSAGSNDSDGSIASYYWEFGDGYTSTQANPSHTYMTDGTYNVTLTVTDNENATGNDVATATITTGGGGADQAMVSAMSMTVLKRGKSYVGKTQVTITSGAAVANALVDITWGGAVSGTASAYTDASGVASFQSAKTSNSTFTATINNVTKTGYFFDDANSVVFVSGSYRIANVLGDVTIYPNPATDIINVRAEQVLIFSVAGQLIKNIDMNGKTSVSIQDLDAGIYFVTTITEGEKETTRLIKQ